MNHFFPMALRILAFFLFAAVSLGAVSLGAHGAEPSDWKVGLAKVKITPTAPLFMAGYQQRDHPSEKVASDLFAKALSLEDPNGTVAVLVTADLIWLSAEICDSVAAAVAEQAGLKREQLLFNASHTHTGPSLSLGTAKGDSGTRNRASGDPQRDMQRNIEYTRHLREQLVEIILAALKNREPARLSWGQGLVNFPMNRRQWGASGVILGVNPRGPVDRTVPVLRVESPGCQEL